VNEFEISQYITETLEGVDVVTDAGNRFFFYNPESTVPPDHRFPFVTLVTNDLYDRFSDLSRQSIFRLNIGIGKHTFRTLFGEQTHLSEGSTETISGEHAGTHDFAALDRVMPHPVYGHMHWVCVLNPGEEIFETTVRHLLSEAYGLAGERYQRQARCR